MKIGIITFHNTHNYGACLQAFALEEYLNKMGYDTFIIDYNSNITKHYRLLIPMFRMNLYKYIKSFCSNIRHYKKRKKHAILFADFRDKYYKLSQTSYKSIMKLKRDYPKCDVYITGSDQVWNKKLVGKYDKGYFLSFGDKKTKRISYAASMGSAVIEDKDKNKLVKLLSSFNAISVREKEIQNKLQELVSVEISHVLDPVFLLTRDMWVELFGLVKKIDKKYIFVYSVTEDEKINKIVQKVANETGHHILEFSKVGKGEYDFIQDIKNDPVGFVQLIYNAEFVISNSFHATVLSIIFEKQFLVIPHVTYNARIDSLLKICRFQDRCISLEEITRDTFNNIDFTYAQSAILKERENSIKFIENSLK